mmetsp:Transcript_67802/g.148828  ORF Transcript_67802/g.148828 Transcript_67802/m.148828 type:complete len:277 (+) Transcript_67802:334-1164(+)
MRCSNRGTRPACCAGVVRNGYGDTGPALLTVVRPPVILPKALAAVSSGASSGRSWGSAPEKSRFHSRPQEVQHISEGRSECSYSSVELSTKWKAISWILPSGSLAETCSTKVRLGVGQRPSSRSDFSFFLFFFGVSASPALASKHQVEKVASPERKTNISSCEQRISKLPWPGRAVVRSNFVRTSKEYKSQQTISSLAPSTQARSKKAWETTLYSCFGVSEASKRNWSVTSPSSAFISRILPLTPAATTLPSGLKQPETMGLRHCPAATHCQHFFV